MDFLGLIFDAAAQILPMLTKFKKAQKAIKIGSKFLPVAQQLVSYGKETLSSRQGERAAKQDEID